MGRQRKSSRPRRGARRRPPPPPQPRKGIDSFSLVLVLAAAGVLAILGFVYIQRQQPHAPSGYGADATLVALGQPVDGIRCETEMLTYHEHAHLDIFDVGRRVIVPQYVGFSDNTCLYWLHTHDASGVIHMEAPRDFHPSLANFFDIWGQPLSRTHVASATVQPGQSMRVFVNLRPYHGDPRGIRLRPYENIAIEIGPPFPKPKPFDFSGL